MKTHAIFVMAYSRPNYLYVCLDSIRHCHDVKNWDVWVSFDNGPKAISHHFCSEILPFYTITSPIALGNRDHPTEMLRCARYFDYQRILFVEDDMMFGPDLLTWIREQEGNWSGTISSHSFGETAPREQVAHMSSAPCSLSAAQADALISFMDSKAYIGLNNVCINQPITPDVTYDVCWHAWCFRTLTACLFSPKQLSFNFGFNGMHYKNARFDSLAFKGPRSLWLTNVNGLSRDPEFATLTRTRGFVPA